MSRFDLADDDVQEQLAHVLAAFAARPGFVRGRVGRATDDQRAWLLTTEWEGVGAYRRALSSYDVKVLSPFLGLARPEASAFEIVARADVAQPLQSPPSRRARPAS